MTQRRYDPESVTVLVDGEPLEGFAPGEHVPRDATEENGINARGLAVSENPDDGARVFVPWWALAPVFLQLQEAIFAGKAATALHVALDWLAYQRKQAIFGAVVSELSASGERDTSANDGADLTWWRDFLLACLGLCDVVMPVSHLTPRAVIESLTADELAVLGRRLARRGLAPQTVEVDGGGEGHMTRAELSRYLRDLRQASGIAGVYVRNIHEVALIEGLDELNRHLLRCGAASAHVVSIEVSSLLDVPFRPPRGMTGGVDWSTRPDSAYEVTAVLRIEPHPGAPVVDPEHIRRVR